MLRAQIAAIIAAAVARLIAAGEFPEAARDIDFDVQDPKSPEHGDFATNFALVATKALGMQPRAIGEKLAAELGKEEIVEAAEVAGPGFVNLRLKAPAIAAYVERVLDLGDKLPQGDTPTPQHPNTSLRINVEFVSVNPNGPITVGSGRGAAFGDTLCRVLEAAGHTVHREYYVNDGVNSEQMRLFAESVRYYVALRVFGEWTCSAEVGAWNEELLQVINAFAGTNRGLLSESPEHVYDAWLLWAHATSGERALSSQVSRRVLENAKAPYYRENRMRQLPLYLKEAWKTGKFVPPFFEFPGGGYRGDYVRSTADLFVRAVDNEGEEFFIDAEEHIFGDLEWFQEQAQFWMIERQRTDLALFGVQFDTWFSEQSLHDSGEVDRRIEELKAKGAADEEPHRVKVKFGKGGQIEEVEREEQPVEDEGDEHGEGASGNTATPQHRNTGTTLWLRSTKFGDDMDRVLRRKDGRLTYIASDVAYHADKFNRPPNADKLITVLGPDHHGYIGRLHAVVAALLEEDSQEVGKEASELTEDERKIYRSAMERDACRRALEEARRKLEVVIFQIVRFVKDGKPAPMRKRDGNIYELRDLILELGQAQAPNASKEEQERVGADVARFFYLMRSHDTHMDFDIDLATKQSDENPVFYVQYAHARISSVLRKASESVGVLEYSSVGPEQHSNTSILQHLTHPRELALIKKIVDLPDEVRRCAEDYGVHRLTTYAIELARSYHYFYDACRIIQPDRPDLTHARLALCQAAKIGLKTSLELLGISAPERMEREERSEP